MHGLEKFKFCVNAAKIGTQASQSAFPLFWASRRVVHTFTDPHGLLLPVPQVPLYCYDMCLQLSQLSLLDDLAHEHTSITAHHASERHKHLYNTYVPDSDATSFDALPAFDTYSHIEVAFVKSIMVSLCHNNIKYIRPSSVLCSGRRSSSILTSGTSIKHHHPEERNSSLASVSYRYMC